MAPKSSLVAFAFLSVMAVAVAVAVAVAGGWKQIERPNYNKEVVEVAKFAVEEYNKEKNKSVAFDSVVRAEEQVVAGIKYRLVIAARDGISGQYRALVLSKLDKSLQLISFEKPIID